MGLKESIFLIIHICCSFPVEAYISIPYGNRQKSPNVWFPKKTAKSLSEYFPSPNILTDYEKTRQNAEKSQTSIFSQDVTTSESSFEAKYDLDRHENLDQLLSYEPVFLDEEVSQSLPFVKPNVAEIFKAGFDEKKLPYNGRDSEDFLAEDHVFKPPSTFAISSQKERGTTDILEKSLFSEPNVFEIKDVITDEGELKLNDISMDGIDGAVETSNGASELKLKDNILSLPTNDALLNFPKDISHDSSEKKERSSSFSNSIMKHFNSNFSSFVFNPMAGPQEIFQECMTPTNESGNCRYVQHCLIPSIISSLGQFMNYVCIIEERFIGICCPKDPVTTLVINWQSSSKNESSMDKPNSQEFSSECGVGTNTRIVGGANADPKAWPWMVALLWKLNKRFFCGGSLINNQYVLTAAHCTFGVPGNRIIARLGEYDFKDTNSSHDDYAVVKIKRHGQYSQITLRNDIALLKLEKPVVFTKSIGTICLPEKKSSYIGKIATLSGWGNLEGGGSSSDVLQVATFPVLKNEECSNIHGVPIPRSLICTAAGSGTGACNGDSGGPLMLLDDDRWKTVGIVSWGRRGCNPEFPTVYTRVSNFLEWIKKHSK